MQSLEERKREEAEFHDQYRAGHVNEQHGTSSNHRFYEAATIVDDYRASWIKKWASVPPATFLDFACGDGLLTIEAAKAGAQAAVGIDISEVSVRNAAETADAAGVGDRTRFLQRDCENTGLPDNAFSACLCAGMLHHLDLTRAFPARVQSGDSAVSRSHSTSENRLGEEAHPQHEGSALREAVVQSREREIFSDGLTACHISARRPDSPRRNRAGSSCG